MTISRAYWQKDDQGGEFCLMDLSPIADPSLDPIKTHILLEFLDYLGIVRYEKFYDDIFEIRVRTRR